MAVKKKMKEKQQSIAAYDKSHRGKKNWVKRITSALILAPLVIGILYVGYPVLSFSLVVLGAVMAFEWEQMTNNQKTTGVAVALAAWLGLVATSMPLSQILTTDFGTLFQLMKASSANMTVGIISLAYLILLFIVAPFLIYVGAKKKGYAHPKMLYWGCYYMALPLLCIQFLSAPVLIFTFVAVCLTDIGGMLFGRMIGGPKIFPETSPGKTWAGSAGGIVLPLIASAALIGYYPEYGSAMVIAVVLLSMVAQAGDYFESKIKRYLKIKDSGNIIPGHGGIFDRIDGMLTAFPFMWLLIYILKIQG